MPPSEFQHRFRGFWRPLQGSAVVLVVLYVTYRAHTCNTIPRRFEWVLMQHEGADASLGIPAPVGRFPEAISRVGSGFGGSVFSPVSLARFVDTTFPIAYICLNFLGDAVITVVGHKMALSWLWSPVTGQLDTTLDGEGASAQFPGWMLVIRRRTNNEV